MAIPDFDDKTVQISKWAVEFCKLLERPLDRRSVNQAAVALRASLELIREESELVLLEQAFCASLAVEEWQLYFRHITPETHDTWQSQMLKLRAVKWWTSIKLQAKRMGW